jgi:hypothetical protein
VSNTWSVAATLHRSPVTGVIQLADKQAEESMRP